MSETLLVDEVTEEKRHRKKSKLKSREIEDFNDPIYAGLDQFEDPRELSQWGPWINSAAIPIKKQIISHEPKKKIIHSPIKIIKATRSISEVKSPIIPPLKPQNQLPVIKERSPTSMKQISFSLKESQKKPNFSLRKRNASYVRSMTRLEPITKEDRPKMEIENKVSKVVFNYCCETFPDECLLSKLMERKGKVESRTGNGYWKEEKGNLKLKPIQKQK